MESIGWQPGHSRSHFQLRLSQRALLLSLGMPRAQFSCGVESIYRADNGELMSSTAAFSVPGPLSCT